MIDIIIPTRWRVELVTQAVNSILSLAVNPTTGVIVACDDDDLVTIAAMDVLQKNYGDRFKYIVGPKSSVVKSVNMAIKTSTKDFVGVICDDGYLTLPEWDKHVEYLFNKHTEYACLRLKTQDACGRDIWNGIDYPFCFIIKREVFKNLGYLDERYNHFYPDAHFGMQMVMENVLMMTSNSFQLHHLEIPDKLNSTNSNKWVEDSVLFHSFWDEQLIPLLYKHDAIRDKWNLLVE